MTAAGVATLTQLMEPLRFYQMQGTGTFTQLDVFGRSFEPGPGRGYNAKHRVTAAIGRGFTYRVIVGLGRNARALTMDPATGAWVETDGIARLQNLTSVGKAMGMGLGVFHVATDEELSDGQVSAAALASQRCAGRGVADRGGGYGPLIVAPAHA